MTGSCANMVMNLQVLQNVVNFLLDEELVTSHEQHCST